MKNSLIFLIKFAVSFLPFVLFAFFNGKANVKKEARHRQYVMPAVAIVYCIVALILLDKLSDLFMWLFSGAATLFDKIRLSFIGDFIRNIYTSWGIYLSLMLFNTLALLVYIIIKRILTAIIGKIKVHRDTFAGSVVNLFYSYDENDDKWYIKEHFGQARTFIKTVYYGSCFVSGTALMISCSLCMKHLISAPFYPAFPVIIIGELAFFIDGLRKDEKKAPLSMRADNSLRVAMYPLLRKPLKELFGDKLAGEGTTVNEFSMSGGAAEDFLASLDRDGGHIGKNYASFIRRKKENGLKPDMDYMRGGYDLATGKSLLFNTPFYDKLNPYIFYAINHSLLTGGKALIVLGRHGTEDDLRQWCEKGMRSVANVPGLYNIDVLSGEERGDEDMPDIGIITRSGVHDLKIHKKNLAFLKDVTFVVIIEPSRLVATAQIGLNLLIRCCSREFPVTFCSVDRNCDGLVDSLSHILMTNITEVSATEYPHGISSYMYWTADDDYLQHRILPGVSRYLGMGTELSIVALKNQIGHTMWYGGDVFPVCDAHWIAKQYYHDLLDYARLPADQETFDDSFRVSFNMSNVEVGDYAYITVEDDRNNLFETRRNFATVSKEQGFINVISSDYMLREYMTDNMEIFTADAKAIPYIAADCARTKRNVILSICLLLCIDSVREETLRRQMVMLNLNPDDPVNEIWNEICSVFRSNDEEKRGVGKTPILIAEGNDEIRFEKDSTILLKREYCSDTGKFENLYKIENPDFADIILRDLQNASYIAEEENKDIYIGSELKGHVYQKYMPGQFLTLNGKYYEMVSTAANDSILVRRASEHIGLRPAYRQIRKYTIHRTEDDRAMGALKSVNGIDIHYQFADFSVETPGYWAMSAYNDFGKGALVKVNGVPDRKYYHKQILKLDFSKVGETFTDSVRMTLTNLLNETFLTLFADNQPFISALTPGEYDAPLTYSLTLDDGTSDRCIYIVEDSQLDIGLLIAVERNINRIFQIIADYLAWNEEQTEESLYESSKAEEKNSAEEDIASAESDNPDEGEKKKKKKSFLKRIRERFKSLFGRKKKEKSDTEKTPRKKKKKKDKHGENEGGSDGVKGTDTDAGEVMRPVESTGETSPDGEDTEKAAEEKHDDNDTGSAETEKNPMSDDRKKDAKALAKEEKAFRKKQKKIQKEREKLLRKENKQKRKQQKKEEKEQKEKERKERKEKELEKRKERKEKEREKRKERKEKEREKRKERSRNKEDTTTKGIIPATEKDEYTSEESEIARGSGEVDENGKE